MFHLLYHMIRNWISLGFGGMFGPNKGNLYIIICKLHLFREYEAGWTVFLWKKHATYQNTR